MNIVIYGVSGGGHLTVLKRAGEGKASPGYEQWKLAYTFPPYFDNFNYVEN